MAGEADVDAAVAAARRGFDAWRAVAPLERARILRAMAARVREHADELAWIDAANGGNPVREMASDAKVAAAQLDFFAGLVTEMKGASIPMGPDAVNFSVREPLGVVARIIPFNHPFMFAAGKSAAPLAAGNSVIVKPPDQAPLSSLRLAELVADLLPPGAFNVLPGDRATGAALASHPGVAMVAIIGSVAAGRAVMRAASETREAGDARARRQERADRVRRRRSRRGRRPAIVGGMNFTWCGQSCGSTSRAFVHASIHDAVVERVKARIAAFRPGLAERSGDDDGRDRERRAARARRVVRRLREGAKARGWSAAAGGRRIRRSRAATTTSRPCSRDVTPAMRIAREEIFGPVLAILRWDDEKRMLDDVNAVPYGLTCSIWTQRRHDRAPHRDGGRRGLRLDQRGRQALPRRAVRRRRAVGLRPRGVPRRAPALHAGEEHPHPAGKVR